MTAEERERVVFVARDWMRTPYHDRARLKGIGVDCGQLLIAVYSAVGLVPEINPAHYLPNPLHKEDTYFLDVLLGYTEEISERDAQRGDIVMYRVARSWTHGAIIASWPGVIIHAVRYGGVIESHGTREGFVLRRPRRFFTIKSEQA